MEEEEEKEERRGRNFLFLLDQLPQFLKRLSPLLLQSL